MRELKLSWLLLGSLIDSIAMSSVWPLTTVYMNQELGHSLVMAGIVLALNSIASILGAFTAGKLYDKHDSYYLILGGILFTWLSFITLIFLNGWPAYPILLVLIGFGTGWIVAITNSMGTAIKGKDGRFVFSMLYFMQNLGVMVGTALVGLIFKHSVAPLFMIASVMFGFFFLVALFTYRIPQQDKSQQSQAGAQATKTKVPKVNMTIIASFFVSLVVMWIFYQQWNSTVSIYMLDMHIPLKLYSFLWTVNGAFILVVQGLLSARGGKLLKDPFHQVYVGIGFFAASYGILAIAHQYFYFVIAMIVLTIGEAIAFPSIPAIINSLSPYDQKGKYQGLASSFPSAGRAMGPLVGSMIVEASSFVFLYAFGMIMVVIVLVVLIIIIENIKSKATLYDNRQ